MLFLPPAPSCALLTAFCPFYRDHNFTELQAKYVRPLNPSSVRLRTASAGLPFSGQRRLLQAPPAEWDWRGSSAVGPVRPLRKGCAAAWAAAALAAVESKAAINRTLPTLPDLSDSQLLDCATGARGYRSAGCAGGYPGGPGCCSRGFLLHRLCVTQAFHAC